MPFPTAASIQTMLGLGYAGAANIDGFWMMLKGSSVSEDDNIIKSSGAIANSVPLATGEIPVRNRRSLSISVSSDLTYSSARCAAANSFNWRNSGFFARACNVSLYLANGEGYFSNQAFVDQISISVPEGQLGSVQFTIKSYVWTDLAGSVTPRLQAAFNPYASGLHQPIPHWAAPVNHPGQPGVPLNWTLNINNGYQFYQLVEGVFGYPPNPRVIVAGPLIVDLNLTTLAYPGQRASEVSSGVQCQMGGYTVSGVAVPGTLFTLPVVYRDPSRQAQGFGEQNVPIKWQAAWKVLGPCPGVI